MGLDRDVHDDVAIVARGHAQVLDGDLSAQLQLHERLAHRRHGVVHDLPRLVVDGGEVDVLHDVAVDVVREVEVREHGAAELVDAQGHQVLAAGKGQRVDGVDHVRKRRGQGELHRRGRVQVHQRIRQGEVAHRGHARPLDEVQALDVQCIYLGQRAQHLVDHVAVVGELRPRGVELVVHAHVEAHQRRVGHAAQRHPEELPGEVGDAPAVVEEVDALRALAADVLRKARHGHGQVQQAHAAPRALQGVGGVAHLHAQPQVRVIRAQEIAARHQQPEVARLLRSAHGVQGARLLGAQVAQELLRQARDELFAEHRGVWHLRHGQHARQAADEHVPLQHGQLRVARVAEQARGVVEPGDVPRALGVRPHGRGEDQEPAGKDQARRAVEAADLHARRGEVAVRGVRGQEEVLARGRVVAPDGRKVRPGPARPVVRRKGQGVDLKGVFVLQQGQGRHAAPLAHRVLHAHLQGRLEGEIIGVDLREGGGDERIARLHALGDLLAQVKGRVAVGPDALPALAAERGQGLARVELHDHGFQHVSSPFLTARCTRRAGWTGTSQSRWSRSRCPRSAPRRCG